jgi:hypothetical protein
MIAAAVTLSCGSAPARIGTTVDRVGMQKLRLGEAPSDLATRQFLSPSSLLRAITADVIGDDEPEVLVRLASGHAIEVRDRNGTLLRTVPAREYITDFAALPSPTSGKDDLVLYLYPNDERGGTFSVISTDGQERARWNVSPPPARFTVADWNGTPSFYYLADDEVEIRTPAGGALGQLRAPEGHVFESLRVRQIGADRLVVLASGDGYTPYHMVAVYDRSGDLLFHEIGNEHAFDLEPGPVPNGFIVSTRSSRWEYRLNSP